MEIVKCSKSTVERTLKKYRETGNCDNLGRRGRREALTESEKNYVRLLSIRNRRKTAVELTSEFNSTREIKKKVSVCTVQRALRKRGLNGRVAAKKPLLRAVNVRKRLQFAKDHVDWTLEQWHQVLWTDETKVEFFGTKRRVIVRRFRGERFKRNCVIPTVKHGGGSINVWAAISAKGTAPLKQIHGTVLLFLYT